MTFYNPLSPPAVQVPDMDGTTPWPAEPNRMLYVDCLYHLHTICNTSLYYSQSILLYYSHTTYNIYYSHSIHKSNILSTQCIHTVYTALYYIIHSIYNILLYLFTQYIQHIWSHRYKENTKEVRYVVYTALYYIIHTVYTTYYYIIHTVYTTYYIIHTVYTTYLISQIQRKYLRGQIPSSPNHITIYKDGHHDSSLKVKLKVPWSLPCG